LNARSIFYAPDGGLRPPWRILVFIFVSIFCVIAAAALAGPIVTMLYDVLGIHGVSNAEWVQAIGLLAGTGVTLRMIDKRPWFFLGGVLVATRSLYAAWMAHFAWNWTMAVLFHTAVSGLPLESPGYRYVDAGPDWATGGPWGPEGGLPAALGMGAGMAYLFVRRRRSPAQEIIDG
jgi:hypothetical protein